MKATLNVNGKPVAVTADDPQMPLLYALRDDLGLHGPRFGCGLGQCGACTVLIDGKAASACVTPVAKAEGRTILTIEGLAAGGALHPVQEAFLAENAFQCGFCTPGMVMATVGLLRETPKPTDAQILAALEQHLCRCGGYPRILKAVRRAAAQAGR